MDFTHPFMKLTQKIFSFFIFSYLWVTFAIAQSVVFSEPLSDRIANYDMAVSLNDTLKTIDADVKLTWKNTSRDTIPDLQFHLYFNAFKNAQSTFSRESSGNMPWAKNNGWGWTEITQMSVREIDHSDKIQFITPDDSNKNDQTVLQVILDKPVLPGEQIEIAYHFIAKIPRNHSRTGWWGDDFFFMVQWFPKIGVYEAPGMRFVPADAPRGRWNCHQFHPSTEFYADFGVYDVRITLPIKYTVAATGIIERERLNEDNTKTVFAYAEDVHDFAWLADVPVLDFEDTWHNTRTGQMVNIRLLLQPGHKIAKDVYFNAAKYTLQYFDDWLGEGAYPYPQLTIVDPQPGSGAGGMEYPTLITGDVFYPAVWWTRGKLRIVETVTSHELSHQYWYGMVANNEFEEAFLDEGFTTYSENRIGAEMFGERTSMLDFTGLKVSLEAVRRPSYALSPGNRDAKISDFTYTAPGGSNLAYNKWSLALKTLENHLGRQNFDEIMRTYFWRWRFKHPSRNDFIAVANDVADENLDWFFDQIIFGNGVVDYAVAQIRNIPATRFEQTMQDSQKRTEQITTNALSEQAEDDPADLTSGEPDTSFISSENKPSKNERYLSTVTIRRIGDVKIPVEILVGFSDGSQQLEKWDGQARTHDFTYSRSALVTKVMIDPEIKIPLDVDLLNNSLTPINTHFMQKYRWKWFFWMQSILALLATIS